MNARLRSLAVLLAMLATMFVLAVGPAAAISLPDVDDDKITLPETRRDQFGLVLLGLTGLASLAAVANAVQQLKGRRPQADGRIRWR